jgi:hypothetical protein
MRVSLAYIPYKKGMVKKSIKPRSRLVGEEDEAHLPQNCNTLNFASLKIKLK